jgi:threonine-phosphate decarboxylase
LSAIYWIIIHNQLIILFEDIPKRYYITKTYFVVMRLDANPYAAKHKPPIHGGITFDVVGDSDRTKILDYSSNINPIGPPPQVKKIIRKAELVDVYPDPDSTLLKKVLGRYNAVPSELVTVGNGASEIIYNFCYAFLSEKRIDVLIPVPTFSEYESASKLVGANISYYKTMNLNDDIDDFTRMIPHKGCVFICNPNNPTGVTISKDNMKILIRQAKKRNAVIFVDECFMELVTIGNNNHNYDSNNSMMRLVSKFDNLFVLRSLTKSFGLAGVRVGYGVGDKKMISILDKIKIPWSVSGLAQQAAIAALSVRPIPYIIKSKKMIKKESDFLINEISKIDGFKCYDTTTNFILIKTKIKSDILQNKLLKKKKILIRNCNSFVGLDNHHIRIAVRTRTENKRLIQALVNITK